MVSMKDIAEACKVSVSTVSRALNGVHGISAPQVALIRQTARRMVHQIGSGWDWSLVPQICANYWRVFALVILGMVIHWLPVRWKRWYRINFALLPLPVMALVVVAVVFIVYQFITAVLQAFIYFQF